ncbi:ParB/RepB/Spo0J family partition protein [Streptomyces smyrnaeus]|uniref:ParB/RepB/Spo0J family partition protein n=1 Tax=Streptomyces smyrnaeus TaxID=1387713 RepID=UPI000C653F84
MTTKTPPKTGTRKPKTSPQPGGTDEPKTTRHITYLDPALVDRDPCNAQDLRPDEKLLTSVRELGVEDAVSVRPLGDGRYGAFKGWRRAQALQIANAEAQAEGRPTAELPVIIRDDLVGKDAETYLLSIVENDHRSDPDASQRAKAYQNLALMEMPAAQRQRASRALGLGKRGLRAAKQAAKLDSATLDRAHSGGLDLEQMADLSEVSELPYAEHRLMAAHRKDTEEGPGRRGHWGHAMAQLRQDLKDRQERAAALEALKQADIPLLSSWQAEKARPLGELLTSIGNPMPEEQHRQCPGHAARLGEDNQPQWFCTDPKEYGHKVLPQANAPKQPRSETERAQARKVRMCNAAWRAARTERRRFLRERVQARSLSEPLREFALRSALSLPHYYGSWASKGKTDGLAELLGLCGEQASPEGLAELIRRYGKARQGSLLFAQVAEANEADMHAKAWEHLTRTQAEWLLLLEADGYTLSEIEQEAVARHRPAITTPQKTSDDESEQSPSEATGGAAVAA